MLHIYPLNNDVDRQSRYVLLTARFARQTLTRLCQSFRLRSSSLGLRPSGLGLRSLSFDPTRRPHKTTGQDGPTSRESRGYRIFGACPPLEGCQGFAVVHYSFTLGLLESTARSTFATLGSISGYGTFVLSVHSYSMHVVHERPP